MAHTGSYAMTIRSQSLGSLTLATTVNSPVVSATDTQHFVLLRCVFGDDDDDDDDDDSNLYLQY